MSRTATGAVLAILDQLEPEAKAGWEAEELNIQEAIAASQAITDKRANEMAATLQQTQDDQATINLIQLDAVQRAELPNDVRGRHEPGYNQP